MIGEKIRKIRKIRGISLNQVARDADITAGYLSDLENEKKNNPSLEILYRIAKALNVDVFELVNDIDLLDAIDRYKTSNGIGYTDPEAFIVTVFGSLKLKLNIDGSVSDSFTGPIVGYEAVHKTELADKADRFMGLLVTDNSMSNCRIQNGDIVLASPFNTAQNGDIAIVLTETDSLIRKIYYSDKTLTLVPDSNESHYQPVIIDTTKHKTLVFGKVKKIITNL